MKSSKLLLLGWLMVFCCAILTPALQAQYRGSLRGTVSDPSGAVISDATVTLVNKQTNSTMTSTSDKRHLISTPPPAPYRITVMHGVSKAGA